MNYEFCNFDPKLIHHRRPNNADPGVVRKFNLLSLSERKKNQSKTINAGIENPDLLTDDESDSEPLFNTAIKKPSAIELAPPEDSENRNKILNTPTTSQHSTRKSEFDSQKTRCSLLENNAGIPLEHIEIPETSSSAHPSEEKQSKASTDPALHVNRPAENAADSVSEEKLPHTVMESFSCMDSSKSKTTKSTEKSNESSVPSNRRVSKSIGRLEEIKENEDPALPDTVIGTFSYSGSPSIVKSPKKTVPPRPEPSKKIQSKVSSKESNRKSLPDTVLGTMSYVESQMSYLDIRENNWDEVDREALKNQDLPDTEIGSSSEDNDDTEQEPLIDWKKPEVPQEITDAPQFLNSGSVLGKVIVPATNPDFLESDYSDAESSLTPITIKSTSSEKSDSMEKDQCSETSEESVISIQDSDEEQAAFNSVPDSKLPEKADDSFENVSTVDSGATVPSRVNEFFNNVPLIESPSGIVVTHSIIQRALTKKRLEDDFEDEEEVVGQSQDKSLESVENRFKRQPSYVEDDERVESVVEESLVISESSELKEDSIQEPVGHDESLPVVEQQKPQNSERSSVIVRQSQLHYRESIYEISRNHLSKYQSSKIRQDSIASRVSPQQTQTDGQIVNSEKTALDSSGSDFELGRVTNGNFKFSAKIKIDIQLSGFDTTNSSVAPSTPPSSPNDSPITARRMKSPEAEKGSAKIKSHFKISATTKKDNTPGKNTPANKVQTPNKNAAKGAENVETPRSSRRQTPMKEKDRIETPKSTRRQTPLAEKDQNEMPKSTKRQTPLKEKLLSETPRRMDTAPFNESPIQSKTVRKIKENENRVSSPKGDTPGTSKKQQAADLNSPVVQSKKDTPTITTPIYRITEILTPKVPTPKGTENAIKRFVKPTELEEKFRDSPKETATVRKKSGVPQKNPAVKNKIDEFKTPAKKQQDLNEFNEVSDAELKILSELYGDTWKTPAVLDSIRKNKPKNLEDSQTPRTGVDGKSSKKKESSQRTGVIDFPKKKEIPKCKNRLQYKDSPKLAPEIPLVISNKTEVNFVSQPKDVVEIEASQIQHEDEDISSRFKDQCKLSFGENNFSIFERQHPTELESTRVTFQDSPKKPATPKKVAFEKKSEEQPTAAGRLRTKRNVKPKNLEVYATNTEDSELSENEWQGSASPSYSGSESDEYQGDSKTIVKKKKVNRKAKSFSYCEEEPIFIVSDDESHLSREEPTEEEERKKVLDLIEAFVSKPKPQIGSSGPNKKPKRKLFTHTHFESDEDAIKPTTMPAPAPVETKDDDDSELDIDWAKDYNLENIFKKPFNKKLDAIKKMEPPKTPGSATKSKIPRTPKTVKTPIAQKPIAESAQGEDKVFGFLKSLDTTLNKALCHPEAIYYRNNYKTKKQDLAEKLFDLFNEKVFENKLSLENLTWNIKLTNTAGRCNNITRKGERFSSIELSDKVLTSADRLRCTLIHELCHAAAWVFNGASGHGTVWKMWAAKANKVFPELPKINVTHSYAIEYKYTYMCTSCKARYNTHSKSKKVENIRCSICKSAIELFINKKDRNGQVVQSKVTDTPVKGFAKFVQENYKKYKAPGVGHGDIMKKLGKDFGALTVEEKKNY